MNTNEKTDALLTEAISLLNNAAYMCDVYKTILSNIPKNEWFRCKDVSGDRACQQVAALMRRLKDAGYAERRVVDDGTRTFTERRYVTRDINNEPKTIVAYDRDGNYIGEIPNPRYYRFEAEHGSYENVEKTVKTSHAEYRLTVSLD